MRGPPHVLCFDFWKDDLLIIDCVFVYISEEPVITPSIENGGARQEMWYMDMRVEPDVYRKIETIVSEKTKGEHT